MRAFTAALFAAAASLVSAVVTPVGEPTGNPISKPGLDEIVPAGAPYTITWTPTTTGPVTILLLRGPSDNVVPIETLVEGLGNTGTYVWTPSLSLEDDVTHYGLQLIDEPTGQYQYSTQFGISNPGYADSPVSSSALPTANATSSANYTSTVVSSETTTSYPTYNTTTAAGTGSLTVPTTLYTTPTAPPTSTPVETQTAAGAAGQVVVSFGSLFLAVAAVFSFAF